jgi:hypothetical protein
VIGIKVFLPPVKPDIKSIMMNFDAKALAVKGLNNHFELFLTSNLIVDTIKESKSNINYKPVLK